MTCGCNDKCELPKALQINNPGEVTLFHRVDIPASQGDDTTYPPKNGLYRNVLLVYLANNHSYLYNSDGIPTRVDGPAGPGTAAGGETGQILAKRSDADYDTTWITQTSANDATLTISRNDTPVGTFTANASVDKTIDIEVPTKTSDLTNDGATGESTYAEATDINAIWEEIEEIEAASDVTDVVGTHAELEAYDTSKLKDNDIIKVLEDETQNDQITYYRWDTDTETFTLIGAIGPYYTKSEADTTFQGKLTAGSNITIDANNEISATDTTYSDFTGATSSVAGAHGLVPAPTTSDPDKFLKGDGTWGTPPGTTYTEGTGIDITGSTISVDTSTVAMQSDLPTKTSDLINDGADNTSTYVEADDYATANAAGVVKVTNAFGTEMSSSGELKGAVVSTSDYPSMWNDALVSKGTLENALSTKINNATLTIQKNGTTVETFTANSSSNKTANITVPTKTSDLTNDGADGTSTYVEADELAPGYIPGEGTDITLPNTQGGRFSDVELKGDTEQATYSGKNIFNLVTPDTQSGITVTANADGSFTVNGTTTGVAAFTFALPTPQPAGTYTISCTSKNQVMDYAGFFIRARNVNQAMLVNGESQLRGNNSYYGVKTFTSTDPMYYVALNLTATGVTYNNMVIYPQIERASAVTDFEPYVGLAPSPSPSYPQAVQTVTGEQTISIAGKNLITLDAVTDGTSLGVSKTFTGSEILLNGTTSGAGSIAASIATGVTLPAGTYAFTLTVLGGTATFPSGTTALYIRNGSNSEIIAWNLNTRPYIVQTKTLSADTPIKFELYTNAAGQIYNNYRLGLQIESGSTATSYKPYQNQTYTINLGKNIVDLSMINVACTQDNANGNLLPGYNTRTCVYKVPVKPSTSYIASCDSAYQIGGTTITYRQDGTFISSSGSGWLTTKTITTDANTYFITFVLRLPSDASMVGISPSSFKLQIEEGSIATAYTPHVELCKIGTYQDYIYKNNGTWYLHKETESQTIDTSAIALRSTYTNIEYAVISKPSTYLYVNTFQPSIDNILCSHASTSDTASWDTSDNI